ncbi:hypothetical protein ACFZAM_31425 [Streptomyces sp. NPDC008079]|uniref:hypothetical protein n=1 Tax=Streptomyces sp. NPDC008079 TaxID=3364806 RepID=UPI0036E7AC0A
MKPPSNPPACQPLANDDFTRLKTARPGLWTNPSTSCITCLKTGTYQWYAEGSREDVVTYECDCKAQWLLHMWFLSAGIGLNYQRLGWDDIVTVPAAVVERIEQYALHAERNIAAGRSIVLWSPNAGSGKTLLMMLLCKAILAQGFAVHLDQFNDILDLFTSTWRDKSERERWDQQVRNVDFLGIDDFGKENKGRIEVVEDAIDRVLRSRVSSDAPTAITTNLTPTEIQQGYGGYVMSLLTEKAVFIEVPGASYRPRRLELAQMEAERGLTRPVMVV